MLSNIKNLHGQEILPSFIICSKAGNHCEDFEMDSSTVKNVYLVKECAEYSQMFKIPPVITFIVTGH